MTRGVWTEEKLISRGRGQPAHRRLVTEKADGGCLERGMGSSTGRELESQRRNGQTTCPPRGHRAPHKTKPPCLRWQWARATAPLPGWCSGP